jgi:orotidine-5'-phosphate decarboxylase
MTKQSCTLGLVTGATDVAALKRIRELAPSAWFLCPGVGAQGGSAEVPAQTENSLVDCLFRVSVELP